MKALLVVTLAFLLVAAPLFTAPCAGSAMAGGKAKASHCCSRSKESAPVDHPTPGTRPECLVCWVGCCGMVVFSPDQVRAPVESAVRLQTAPRVGRVRVDKPPLPPPRALA